MDVPSINLLYFSFSSQSSIKLRYSEISVSIKKSRHIVKVIKFVCFRRGWMLSHSLMGSVTMKLLFVVGNSEGKALSGHWSCAALYFCRRHEKRIK
jgi:hypothetical protein